MHPSVVVQRPAGPPAQLFLLFHGFGTDEHDMVPLGQLLATDFPNALVVSVGAVEPSDSGPGRQWFSLRGITDENRVPRVAAAMPAFRENIRAWQADAGVDPAATALVGFSQGAIMALESTAAEAAVAGRVVAIAGRYAALPTRAPQATTLHLIHGKADPVVSYGHTIAAAERIIGLGGDATADVLPFVGHLIDDEVVALMCERLTGYVPRRLWDEAMRAAR